MSGPAPGGPPNLQKGRSIPLRNLCGVSRRLRAVFSVVVVVVAAVVVLASARGRALAQPRDAAAGEALFIEGRRLMKVGDRPAACAKFAESQRLDPAVGTLANLADCEEQRG